MATRDDEYVITAEVPLKLGQAVEKLGYTLGVKLPTPNAADAAAAQEFYIATQVYRFAEARRDRAKDALKPHITVPNAKGPHVVHDSATAAVVVDNRAQPRRLSEPHVVNMLCREFKIDVERAKALIDGCKVASKGFQQHINAVLK